MNLKHFLLYVKGWYQPTTDIWNDLKIVLKLDGYTPFSKNDVFMIILNNLPDIQQFKPFTLLPALHPSNCWKFGYYVKGNHYFGDQKDAVEYDYEMAVLKYILSELRFIDKSF